MKNAPAQRLALSAALLLTSAARAAEQPAALEEKVDRLREEIAQLRVLLAQSLELDRQAAPAAAAPDQVRVSYDEGVVFAGAGAKVKLGGYAQYDGRWFEQGSPGVSEIRARRVRPELRGTLPNDFGWRVQMDFSQSSANLVEGWMSYDGWGWGSLKAGQFKEPFGLEALCSAAWLDTVERSMISTAFAPMEDVGAALSGRVLGRRLFYGVGVFNGRGRNVEDNQNDKDFVGRAQLTPWADDESPWISGLSVGVSATHGEQDEDLGGAAYRSAGRVPFLRYAEGAASDGNRDRWGADVEWFVGPASVKAEYLEIEQEMIYRDAASLDATFDGWAVTLTCLLTGEEKPHNRALRDVGLGQGSTGAWELVLRMEEFNAEKGLLESGLAVGTDRARAYTAGLNWYPNAHVRLMLDGVHVDYDDEITADGQTTDDEDVALLRCQYSL